MWKFLKGIFKADYVYCTITVFGFMLAFAGLADRFAFLNPIEIALSDFEMTDIVFSHGIRESPKPDTNIVLVNFGSLSRRGIARQIEIIAAQKPKVLGIDCSFRVLKKPEEDSLLASALSKIKNLVLYSKLDFSSKAKEDVFDTLLYCNPMFAKYGKSGFCNLITKGSEQYLACRTFPPKDKVGNHTELAFGLQIANFVDSNKVKRFLARENNVELINFKGNKELFYSLDVQDILGYEDEFGFKSQNELPVNLKDKIVIMGYMGDDFGPKSKLTREDKFHTPMNENYAGKAYPDMFGVVIHANIVSMVLDEVPINQMGDWLKILLAIFVCYINVVFFFYIHDYFPSWYDLVVKTVQVVEVVFILFIAVNVYGSYRYQMDVTYGVIAVGLCGDILEVYTGAMYNIVGRFRDRIKLFLIGRKKYNRIKE
jgi:CHASE2 domain-containing sensor protein